MLTLLQGRTRSRSILFDASTTKLPLLLLQIRTYSSLESKPLSEKRRVKSERVKSLLKANGFTETQIAKITRFHPTTLFADPEKTLAPKIDFFRSIGLSETDLPKILSATPSLLEANLKNQLIPNHIYLKSLLRSDEYVVKIIKKRSLILTCGSVEKILDPKVNLLSAAGVLEPRIDFMLLRFPSAFLVSHTKFKSTVEEAIRLGFDPVSPLFLYAVSTLSSLSKATFDSKWAAYKKWNLSDDNILMAFLSNPLCMELSVEKITRNMDFLVNKMGFEAVKIAESMFVVFYSLENRTIPRCRVIQVLISKGILKKNALSISAFLVPSETNFLAKYVTIYEDQLPDLLDIYKGKKEWLETRIAFEA